jgi:hypothetical protein
MSSEQVAAFLAKTRALLTGEISPRELQGWMQQHPEMFAPAGMVRLARWALSSIAVSPNGKALPLREFGLMNGAGP